MGRNEGRAELAWKSDPVIEVSPGLAHQNTASLSSTVTAQTEQGCCGIPKPCTCSPSGMDACCHGVSM